MTVEFDCPCTLVTVAFFLPHPDTPCRASFNPYSIMQHARHGTAPGAATTVFVCTSTSRAGVGVRSKSYPRPIAIFFLAKTITHIDPHITTPLEQAPRRDGPAGHARRAWRHGLPGGFTSGRRLLSWLKSRYPRRDRIEQSFARAGNRPSVRDT